MVVSVVNKLYKFSDFGFKNELLRVINEVGYIDPTIIQMKCIPFFLQGYDIFGIAKTGSGKTASFVLPILNKIDISFNNFQVLVLTPTRELSIQITSSFMMFAKYIYGVKIISIYGGQKYSLQLSLLRKGYHIIVSTPGRLLDYVKRNIINLSSVKILVLDEADEMLRMGFINDVESVISMINSKRQIALFSATMPVLIRKIAVKFMNNPKEISVFEESYIPCNIKQYYCLVFNISKVDVLLRILEVEFFKLVIIFVRTKSYTIELSSIIESKGYLCSPLNGDMNQYLRENIIRKFRSGKLKILVATDVASRGLDIVNVNLIINYDVPLDVGSYIHRVGRTGRAGNVGKTILLLENRDKKFLNSLLKFTKSKINNFDIPNNLLLKKTRLLRLSKLIMTNFDVDRSFEFFLKEMFQDVVKLTNLSNEEISISLFGILYKKCFGSFILKNDNIFVVDKKLAIKGNRKSKLIYYKVGIGKSYNLSSNKVRKIIVSYLNIKFNDILYFRLYNKYCTFKISSGILINRKNINNFIYLNKKIWFKKIFFKRNKEY